MVPLGSQDPIGKPGTQSVQFLIMITSSASQKITVVPCSGYSIGSGKHLLNLPYQDQM